MIDKERYARIALLAAAGAIVGLGIFEALFGFHQAQVGLQSRGDTTAYFEGRSYFSSVERARKFGTAHKLEQDPTFIKLMNDLSNDPRGKRLRIAQIYRVQKNDLQQIPEQTGKELLQGGLTSQSEIRIHAADRTQDGAARLADMVVDFVRDVILWSRIRAAFDKWIGNTDADLAAVRARIAMLNADLDSTNKKTVEIDKLRSKFKGAEDLSTLNSRFQSQQIDARYLSPLQQMIALDSTRIELAEQLRIARAEQVRLMTLNAVASEFTERLTINEQPIELAKSIRERVRKPHNESDPERRIAIERALTEIDARISSDISRFESASTDKAGLVVYPPSLPGRIIFAALGLLLALASYLSAAHLRKFIAEALR